MTEKSPSGPENGLDVGSHIVKWPGCPGCSAIENDSQCRTLVDGVIVCSTCPDALLEDEARALLAKPLITRREVLQAIEREPHGFERANTLREVMVQVFAAGVAR